MIGVGGYSMSTESRGNWRCLECGTIPVKGSHCMCHGIYIDLQGSVHSVEGSRYEAVENDDSTEEDVDCGC